MNRNPEKSAATAAGKASVVRGVIHGLLKGRWHGGDRLTELEAAGLFKVSRTPVREALLELSSMGVVELRRNCGAVFHPFGERELRDLYAVRSLLEVEATRLAAENMDPSVIAHLQAGFERLKHESLPDKGWRLDRELHTSIARGSGNPRLAGEIARYSGLVQTMREAVGGVLANIHSTSLSDHLRILDALKARNPVASAESMKAHLDQAAESAVTALNRVSRHVKP